MAYTKEMREAKKKAEEDKLAEQAKQNETLKTEKRVKVEPDPHELIPVKNGFHGRLTYKSRRDGTEVVWAEYGDEEFLEYQELKSARSSQKKFYTENWWIIDYEYLEVLGVLKFYENAINEESIDSLKNKSPDKIKEIVSKMSNGQKKSLSYKVIEMIKTGELDSVKTINALKESLNLNQIEE